MLAHIFIACTRALNPCRSHCTSFLSLLVSLPSPLSFIHPPRPPFLSTMSVRPFPLPVLQHDYDGDKAGLGSLEQFFLTVADIPRYEQRLISLLFKLRLDAMLVESRARADKIRAALDCLGSSTSLRAMLEYVLAVGNYLNADNASRGGAYGALIKCMLLLRLRCSFGCAGRHVRARFGCAVAAQALAFC